MLPYPINVDEEDNVKALDQPRSCFPDIFVSVLGAKFGMLPDEITLTFF